MFVVYVVIKVIHICINKTISSLFGRKPIQHNASRNLGFFGRKNSLIFEIVLIVIEFDVKAVIKRG